MLGAIIFLFMRDFARLMDVAEEVIVIDSVFKLPSYDHIFSYYDFSLALTV